MLLTKSLKTLALATAVGACFNVQAAPDNVEGSYFMQGKPFVYMQAKITKQDQDLFLDGHGFFVSNYSDCMFSGKLKDKGDGKTFELIDPDNTDEPFTLVFNQNGFEVTSAPNSLYCGLNAYCTGTYFFSPAGFAKNYYTISNDLVAGMEINHVSKNKYLITITIQEENAVTEPIELIGYQNQLDTLDLSLKDAEGGLKIIKTGRNTIGCQMGDNATELFNRKDIQQLYKLLDHNWVLE